MSPPPGQGAIQKGGSGELLALGISSEENSDGPLLGSLDSKLPFLRKSTQALSTLILAHRQGPPLGGEALTGSLGTYFMASLCLEMSILSSLLSHASKGLESLRLQSIFFFPLTEGREGMGFFLAWLEEFCSIGFYFFALGH